MRVPRNSILRQNFIKLPVYLTATTWTEILLLIIGFTIVTSLFNLRFFAVFMVNAISLDIHKFFVSAGLAERPPTSFRVIVDFWSLIEFMWRWPINLYLFPSCGCFTAGFFLVLQVVDLISFISCAASVVFLFF